MINQNNIFTILLTILLLVHLAYVWWMWEQYIQCYHLFPSTFFLTSLWCLWRWSLTRQLFVTFFLWTRLVLCFVCFFHVWCLYLPGVCQFIDFIFLSSVRLCLTFRFGYFHFTWSCYCPFSDIINGQSVVVSLDVSQWYHCCSFSDIIIVHSLISLLLIQWSFFSFSDIIIVLSPISLLFIQRSHYCSLNDITTVHPVISLLFIHWYHYCSTSDINYLHRMKSVIFIKW